MHFLTGYIWHSEFVDHRFQPVWQPKKNRNEIHYYLAFVWLMMSFDYLLEKMRHPHYNHQICIDVRLPMQAPDTLTIHHLSEKDKYFSFTVSNFHILRLN